MAANKQTWKTVAKLGSALVATGVLAAGLVLPYVGGLGMVASQQADKFLSTKCTLVESQPPSASTIYARDGKTVIARIFTQDRKPVPLQQIPDALKKALIATEDRRFYSHHGVDMRGLIRSAVNTSSGDTQGGSTLTMQYVKQARYYQDVGDIQAQQADIEQTLERKIEDAQCALAIEQRETKDEILANYLNIAFFGENSFSIQSAAQTYFGVDVNKLTLPQSALLVGLLRAPTTYDPFINPGQARDRRNQVIQNLADVGDISQADAKKYKATPVSLSTKAPPPIREGCANSGSSIPNVGFFCDYVTQWLRSTGGISQTRLETGGLKIVTTLDASLQTNAQANIASAMPANSPMTAVLPVVQPSSGDVLAMATSKLYGTATKEGDTTHTSLPLFTDYTAFGSSTYKLFPLLAALSTGVPANWPLQTPQDNLPYTPMNCSTDAGVTNGDALTHYNSNETLASALAKSSNTYFVALADQLLNCDLQPIVDVAEKLGMKALDQPSGEGNQTVGKTIVKNGRAAQLVLGAIGTSPLELAGAYAGVANAGRFFAPAPVLSITDEAGRSVDVKRPAPVQAVAPQVALQAVDILTGDTVRSGTSAEPFRQWYRQNSSAVAGKTGTGVAVVNGSDTKQNASLWFVGMTPDLVATSALINFDHPNAAAAGLPGVQNPATDAYGAYASGVWLSALSSSLQEQSWTWPSPYSVEGNEVPNVTGESLDEAKKELEAAGFKMVRLDAANDLMCPSALETGDIAYYGPQKAAVGSTITVCPSSGSQQTVYTPPPPKPRPRPRPRPEPQPQPRPQPQPATTSAAPPPTTAKPPTSAKPPAPAKPPATKTTPKSTPAPAPGAPGGGRGHGGR